MKKLLLIAIPVMILAFSLCTFAMNFVDVAESDWYYEDVKGAYETGLINGKTVNEYKPDDNLTYAEAVKLAACMHQLYTEGKVTLTNGSPEWYSTYVEYCKNNNILSGEYEYNYNANATRAGYMTIFANALPNEAMKQINSVADNSIPDVPSSKSYAPFVYKLYRAGILQGVDEKHNCNPDSYIKRSEVAAIITRMMNEDKRLSFSLKVIEEHEHEYTYQINKPTCTKNGHILYTCIICGHEYSKDYTYRIPHTYHREVIEPTATEMGYTINTCDCGHTYKDKYVYPLDFDISDIKPVQVPGSDFINTSGVPTSERGRCGLVAGEMAVHPDGYITPRLDKNLGYSDNLAVLNGYVFNIYGSKRFFRDGISTNDEEDGRFARIVQDGDRWGVNVFQWRKSYDSHIGTNSELNMVLEAFYFVCGDRQVAYALWSAVDYMNINNSPISNDKLEDMGFEWSNETASSIELSMNGVHIYWTWSGPSGAATDTFYFE